MGTSTPMKTKPSGKKGDAPKVGLRMSDAEHSYLLEAMLRDGQKQFAPWIMQVLRKKAEALLGRQSPALVDDTPPPPPARRKTT